ncbi:MAG: phosphotransferase, partial [Haloarculaceae archaeon]
MDDNRSRGRAGNGPDPAVRAALAAAVPDREPVALEPLGRGNRKRTLLARFADRESVVVQRPGRAGGAGEHGPDGGSETGDTGTGSELRAEALVLRALGERTGLPVPAVLADGTVDGTSYLVTEYVAGEGLHEVFADLDRSTQRRLVRAFGRHLAAVHDVFDFAG